MCRESHVVWSAIRLNCCFEKRHALTYYIATTIRRICQSDQLNCSSPHMNLSHTHNVDWFVIYFLSCQFNISWTDRRPIAELPSNDINFDIRLLQETHYPSGLQFTISSNWTEPIVWIVVRFTPSNHLATFPIVFQTNSLLSPSFRSIFPCVSGQINEWQI